MLYALCDPDPRSGLCRVIDLSKLPANVRRKELKSDAAFYWSPPSYDRPRGCPLHSQALGRERMAAILAGVEANRELNAWRDSVRRIAAPGTRVRRSARRPAVDAPARLRSLRDLQVLRAA